MHRAKTLIFVVCLGTCLGSAPAFAQDPAPPATATSEQLARLPGYKSLYCSGFITDRNVQEGLFVMSGEEGGTGTKTQFIPGDMVFLSRGAGFVVNPSGEYMIIRKVKDTILQPMFQKQRDLLRELGTAYEEVGRIKVRSILENTTIAEVMHACDPIFAGDIAIPFNVKPAPQIRQATRFDLYAPPTGKNLGMIAASKEWQNMLGNGDFAYLDIGGKDGVAVGQYYRIFRPFQSWGRHLDGNYRHISRSFQENMLEEVLGQRLNLRLTKEDLKNMPRQILGELLIIHVEGRSATGMVTFAAKDIFIGDRVELQ